MKKQPCPRLSVRLSDGQLCVLLGLIAVGLEERPHSFGGEDLRQLVDLHRAFCRKLGFPGTDYSIIHGQVVETRNPQRVLARVGRRRFSRLSLALCHG